MSEGLVLSKETIEQLKMAFEPVITRIIQDTIRKQMEAISTEEDELITASQAADLLGISYSQFIKKQKEYHKIIQCIVLPGNKRRYLRRKIIQSLLNDSLQ